MDNYYKTNKIACCKRNCARATQTCKECFCDYGKTKLNGINLLTDNKFIKIE